VKSVSSFTENKQKKMPWIQITATTNKSNIESLEEIMLAFGALSVTLSDAEDQPQYEPLPGETKLWDQTIVTGLFETDAPVDEIKAQILQHKLIQSTAQLNIEDLADQAWERCWMENFKPMKFGQNTWICPTGFQVEEPASCIIDLDPGLAFGTGTHPTTALCLTWLDRNAPSGQTVIDFGCGSGILAIAAIKQGAHHCFATDIDPQAIEATLSNAEKNHVKQSLSCVLPDTFHPDQNADLVLANILSDTLIRFAEQLSNYLKPGGSIVLSGILIEQIEQVTAVYDQYFQLDTPQTMDEWALVSGKKRF
jgi:ribosomal protein L11 methyltransferase